MQLERKNIYWFDDILLKDISIVGGKNSSLGEMRQNLSSLGIKVPNGFAISTYAYKSFLEYNNLTNKINELFKNLNVNNLDELTQTSKFMKESIINSALPYDIEEDIKSYYHNLTKEKECSLAVRSSATSEDLPGASFAGQQESFLNVQGIEDLLLCIKKVYASLFSTRAISYRINNGFSYDDCSISVGVQLMIRSDLSSSGVLFTVDTESGFEDVIIINSSVGLGEGIVQGSVNPDEFIVSKHCLKHNKKCIINKRLGSKDNKLVYNDDMENPIRFVNTSSNERNSFSLNDEQIIELSHYAWRIEEYYKKPMDIEWGIDGLDGQIYILQARPETVVSNTSKQFRKKYTINGDFDDQLIVQGRSVGQLIGVGEANVIIDSSDINKFKDGQVLVTDITDPNWEPIMRKASAIVTNRGGRTCHAAIIARELGIPAVIGTKDATSKIFSQDIVSVSCAEGDVGKVYRGEIEFTINTIDSNSNIDNNATSKIMLNVASPDKAFQLQKLPNNGIGLARLEFIINNIGIHPKAILDYNNLSVDLQKIIHKKSAGYNTPKEYYIEKIVEGITTLAAAFYPKDIIVRLSDFKSNEYNRLIGGNIYEPNEENPMIGFRGVSRYLSQEFSDCFSMECEALKISREEYGFDNIKIMVPFVRTIDEASNIIELLKHNGLKRGENNLKIMMMCEVPSNAILADEFIEFFDGFSIGSNDLTQLTLGLDRDSSMISHLFDETSKPIKKLIGNVIDVCLKNNKYVGICGQAPSDYPEFANWLIKKQISSISLNPDSVLEVIETITK